MSPAEHTLKGSDDMSAHDTSVLIEYWIELRCHTLAQHEA